MQKGNGGGDLEGMFDDDLLSTFDTFDEAGINGDELLEALSNHDNNSIFDDIDVDNDINMNAAPPPLFAQGTPHYNSNSSYNNNNNNPQSFHDTASNNNNNNNFNINNNSFTSFDGASKLAPVTHVNVNTFNRRSSDEEGGRSSKYSSRRRNNKKKSNFNTRADIMSNEPLFGGNIIRRQSHHMFDDDDDLSESDVASACSAPADLMALCGLYDDPTNTPDVLDVQRLFFNPMSKLQQQQQQQGQHSSATNMNGLREMMFSGGGQDEETMLIRQRQQQLLQEERQLQEAATSQRPRRRKTYDGTMSLPLMDELRMNMMQVAASSGGGGGNHIYGDTDMNAMPGNNVPIKRRKSEPFMMDFFGDEMNGGDVNNMGGTNLNRSSHSLDHMMGFPSSYRSAGIPSNNAPDDNWRKSALDVAVEEAQEKINQLKQLLYVSQNSGGGGGGGGLDSGQGQQQIQQQQSATKSWWASLASELGGTGLNLSQANLEPAQDLTIPTKAPKKPKKKPKKKPEQPAAPAQIPLPDKPDPEILKLDPTKLMKKLQESMSRTSSSMRQLQEWDRANGLPKSHSQTMVNSNKSRKQLAEGTGLTPSGSKVETKTEDEIRREKLSAMHAL